MGMKRFIHKDGKYAWFDENKHKVVDGELVLLKQEVTSSGVEEEEKPRRGRGRSTRS